MRMRWACHVARIREKKKKKKKKKKVYMLLVGKLEETRPLSKPRCRWVDNIKTNLVDIGWGVMDWIFL
jgi:hypothetical protein